jgi:hypothetical protein
MKPFKSLIITLLACTLLFGGCKKKDAGPAYQIAFTFNGASYTMANPSTVVNINELLTIQGRSGNAIVTLQFVNPQVGVADIGEGGSMAFETGPTVDDVYSCSSGTITVVTYTTTNISGTFDVMAIHNPGDTPLPVKGMFNIKIH